MSACSAYGMLQGTSSYDGQNQQMNQAMNSPQVSCELIAYARHELTMQRNITPTSICTLTLVV